MPGTSVERHTGNTVAIPDAHEWQHIEKVAGMIAKSAMCPKAFQKKPEDIMVVALSLRGTNVPFTINTLNQCYVIDGRVEMMAQLKVGIAASHGWDIWFEPHCVRCKGERKVLTNPADPFSEMIVCPDCGGSGVECDDTRAVAHFKAPGKPERTMEYTIKEARDAHLLDEWVETWVDSGEKWPDGKPKNRKLKVTVAVDGEPLPTDDMPDWARTAKASGPASRKEPWFANRPAMLMARAITKGMRYAAPHLTLGIGDPDMESVAEESIEDARPAWEEARRLTAEGAETGEMVPFVEAGNQMLDAYVARGLSRDKARPCASLLWTSYGLKKGDSVLRSRLDQILDVINSEAPPETQDSDQEPPPVGGLTEQLDAALERAKATPAEPPSPAAPAATEVVSGAPAGAVDAQPKFAYGPDEEPF